MTAKELQMRVSNFSPNCRYHNLQVSSQGINDLNRSKRIFIQIQQRPRHPPVCHDL